MPAPVRLQALALAATALLLAMSGRASSLGDSLRAVLDSDATREERASALVAMAERTLDRDAALALAHAGNAARLAAEADDPMLQHRALVALRDCQERLGMQSEFLRTTTGALELARRIGQPALLAGDLQAISKAYACNNRHDKAVLEARNALAMVIQGKDAEAIIGAELFLADALLRAGKADEALRRLGQALAKARNQLDEARIRQRMAQAHMQQGRPQDAVPNLALASRIMEAQAPKSERFQVAMDHAEACIAMGRLPDAEGLVETAQALSTGSADERLALLRSRLRMAQARSEWRSAHDLLRRLKHVEDSLHMATQRTALTGLQVMYELGEMDRDNAELRDRNARNEAVIADQRLSNRLLLAFASVFLALAAALLMMARRSRRLAVRLKLKTQVTQRQKDEIHAKNLELQRQNMRLADTLMNDERKDMVIKEIHHRVKNNLQVIDSLLNLQRDALTDPALVRVLREAQSRIRAMAQVHESIYRNAGINGAPLRTHLEQIARHAVAAFGMHDRVSVVIESDDIRLDSDDLMTLSLALNELLTNSLKHGFREGGTGTIGISVRAADGGMEVRYAESGAEQAGGRPFMERASFGMELVRGLAVQLNGELVQLDGKGTTLCLRTAPDSLLRSKAS